MAGPEFQATATTKDENNPEKQCFEGDFRINNQDSSGRLLCFRDCAMLFHAFAYSPEKRW